MPKAEDVTRMRHMLDAARKAVEFTQNCKRADLDIVWKIVSADLPPLAAQLEKTLSDNKLGE